MAKAAAHAERLRSQLAAAKLAELHALRAECTALGASANASNADARAKADADTVRGRVVELRSQIGVVERELAVLDVDAYRRYHAKEGGSAV